MTLIVGICCSDGVVIGTDSGATFELAPTMSQPFQQKIAIIDGCVIVAGTGAIGLGQRFTAITKQHWESKTFQNMTETEIGEFLSHEAIRNFGRTGINPLHPPGPGGNPEGYGALVAMPCKQKPALIEFPAIGFQPEIKTEDLWYASMGSGQNVADPLLGFVRATFFWENNAPPSCADGIFATTMVLKLSCYLSPSSVAGPIEMAVLRPEQSKRGQLHAYRLTAGQLSEHEQSVTEAIKHFREYREILRGKGAQAPSPPAPPPRKPNSK